ncbi:nicotinamide riboside transporter PnuC [Leptospira kanakyensis]|uniref:Nicotinamide riboside transporter PnuC n=1 Tax=Leptospira kanakyensis TaxID=2484968 RepID=A0A6N4QPF8_9LEPT|nr:nicotinamide riboside transporter PnuC [Leptospira kanakyensis]TGK54374.1 nicotinamide riboside transporter PnuC [Leptospira kanakyensis]TGK58907.1 nicotinamide riboside transporter PnuC [Leptospira kanakyensis]TGK75308.1 nicotinamide riboside transporter PnuC [Leptospira kanakyensis]
MTDFFLYGSIEFPLFSVFGYTISLIEFLGTSSGLVCVYLASRNHILTWPIGIFNSICFFFLFFQIQLYSDMLLQIYFFGSSIYGWYVWRKRTGAYIKIQSLGKIKNLVLVFVILCGTYFLGETTSRLPLWFPQVFVKPPEFLYWDAFTTVASIIANFLLAQRKLESWFLWVFVDVVCITIYSLKEIPFVTLEYIVFLLIAFYGCYHWYKEYKLHSNGNQ